MASDQLLYQIAITKLPGIGSVLARNLISYCGGVKNVFESSKAKLERVPGIGAARAKEILSANLLEEAEQEIAFVQRNKIEPLFYTDQEFPKRLKQCYDHPTLLYYKGTADLNADKIIGIVGTRDASNYGKDFCKDLVKQLAPFNPIIVSGLAYGIDIEAHKAALENDLETVAVLGHGLDKLYPSVHAKYAKQMKDKGGILTEFNSKDDFDRKNFVQRNRIVAGMIDALVVVETKKKGGALITADLANSYNRSVFALPGPIKSPNSEGCHFLVKTFRAALMDDVQDIVLDLGWDEESVQRKIPKQLNLDLEPGEKTLVELLQTNERLGIDDISVKINIPKGVIASKLLTLELKGLVRSLPGKVYEIIA